MLLNQLLKKMGFGKNYSPVQEWIFTHQHGSEAGALNTGDISDDRKDMMRLTLGGFRLSLIETHVGGVLSPLPGARLLQGLKGLFSLPGRP